MSCDIYSRDDIRNAIMSVATASAAASAHAYHRTEKDVTGAQHLDDYRAGYEDALLALAVMFGIPLRPGTRIAGERNEQARRELSRLPEG